MLTFEDAPKHFPQVISLPYISAGSAGAFQSIHILTKTSYQYYQSL